MKELDPKSTNPADKTHSKLTDPSLTMSDAPEGSGEGGDGEERPPDVGVEN